ncbi:MAG: esterase [SAR86 cluster bacterium]|uniref:Esterase n=1 Tax=SAR86 cluster bacterium TaxID=2030880 RepID=A0A2A4MU39_9GAMM|nr:MAG: esterase [SAR86 cluster bacterium]
MSKSTHKPWQNILVLYLHGFLSSPQSHKAQQTLKYCQDLGLAEQVFIPELSANPAEDIAQLCGFIEANRQHNIVLIGSSLGGYYAGYLAERYKLLAALINPAVRPYEHWQDYVGEHINYYSKRRHIVSKQHKDELLSLHSETLKYPQNYLLLVQCGDETLDYRQAVEKYRSSQSIIQAEGNHSFVNFESVLPEIFAFFAKPIA